MRRRPHAFLRLFCMRGSVFGEPKQKWTMQGSPAYVAGVLEENGNESPRTSSAELIVFALQRELQSRPSAGIR